MQNKNVSTRDQKNASINYFIFNKQNNLTDVLSFRMALNICPNSLNNHAHQNIQFV
jgi:hypothetical protein